MNTAHCKQTGIGVIEVMIALAVIMFAALVIASVQSNALISVRITKTHFGVNEQAQEMLEMLRANKMEAQAGNYNVEFDTTIDTDSDSNPVLVNIAAWKDQVEIQLPDGAGQIDCDITRCEVSIRWRENVDGSDTNQFYRIAGLN